MDFKGKARRKSGTGRVLNPNHFKAHVEVDDPEERELEAQSDAIVRKKVERFQNHDLGEWLGDVKPRNISAQNTRVTIEGMSKEELEAWVGQQVGDEHQKFFQDIIQADHDDSECKELVFGLVQIVRQTMSMDEKLAALMRTVLNIESMTTRNEEKITKLYAKDAFSMQTMIAEFKRMDDDNSGFLDPEEFSAAIEEMNPPITLLGSEFRSFWRVIDPSDDGEVSIKEFTTILEEEHEKYPKLDTQELLKNFITETVEVIRAKAIADNADNPESMANIWDMDPHSPYNQWPGDDGLSSYYPRLTMWLHKTLEDQDYSTLAFTIFCFISMMIMISIITYILQSEPQYYFWKGWDWIEGGITLVFTIELGLRLMVCRNPLKFWATFQPRDRKGEPLGEAYYTWYMYDGMNIVDFLACTPFYLEQANVSGSFLGVIRIVRLFRLARLRAFKGIQTSAGILISSISRSWEESGTVILCLVAFEVIIFSSVIYVAEKGTQFPGCAGLSIKACSDPSRSTAGKCWWYDTSTTTDGVSDSRCLGHFYRTDHSQVGLACSNAEWLAGDCFEGDTSPFYSIGSTVWWSFTTITTVGYGDMSPTQPWGKLLGTLTMLTGLIVISIFVVVVAGNFEEAREAYNIKRRVEQKVAEMQATADNAADEAAQETAGGSKDEGDEKQEDEVRVLESINAQLDDEEAGGEEEELGNQM